jgi:hypothetical protein
MSIATAFAEVTNSIVELAKFLVEGTVLSAKILVVLAATYIIGKILVIIVNYILRSAKVQETLEKHFKTVKELSKNGITLPRIVNFIILALSFGIAGQIIATHLLTSPTLAKYCEIVVVWLGSLVVSSIIFLVGIVLWELFTKALKSVAKVSKSELDDTVVGIIEVVGYILIAMLALYQLPIDFTFINIILSSILQPLSLGLAIAGGVIGGVYLYEKYIKKK